MREKGGNGCRSLNAGVGLGLGLGLSLEALDEDYERSDEEDVENSVSDTVGDGGDGFDGCKGGIERRGLDGCCGRRSGRCGRALGGEIDGSVDG